ncbi:MAG TPA: MBL fold metallo-hydrolase, partial [Syntrophomonas sp.]|nr:MBL fold metallo-hydrolase [Syntrophomonas sp.]
MWVLDRDALKEYLLSLEKIAALDVHLVLPAHRVLIYDLRGRVEEIKQHHVRRIEDILGIVGSQKMSAAQVAKRMRW